MPAVARLTALLVVTCFGLGGCGGSAEPSPMPTVSTSASSSPTGPAEPELPQAAKADTKAGAVAFVKHYVALLNHAQESGQTDAALEATASDCAECKAVLEDIAAVYASGGSISGGNWTVVRTLAERSTDPRFSGWFVLVRVKSGSQTVNRPGESPQRFKAGSFSHEFLAARIGDNWKVAKWTHVG